jgi:sterol desaturase/sphingolipid hydroxylase (fatty acid hydroxylase superfamily)
MLRSVVAFAVGFGVLAAVFGGIEWAFAAAPRPRRTGRALRTDLLYWVFTPVVTRTLTSASIVIAVALLFAFIGSRFDRASLHGFGPTARQPLPLQVLEMLVVGDLLGYWLHRAFHRGRLWRFHAVHHSSVVLDWLSAVRQHPVNDAAMKLLEGLPLLAAGFNPTALKAYAPILAFYAIFVHANVNWDFGPLRQVIATPVFHRWHHSKDPLAIDTNFAGLFPFWDRLFGTLYLPADRFPEDFGTTEPVPDGLLAQLAYPLRAASRQG